MNVDHRSLDDELTKLKTAIRCTSNGNQAAVFCRTILGNTFDEFLYRWKPTDFVVASRKNTRDGVIIKLFSVHKNKFPNELVPLQYHPKDTRLQNILVDIPGTGEQKKNSIK